jgi:hypothetical protein
MQARFLMIVVAIAAAAVNTADAQTAIANSGDKPFAVQDVTYDGRTTSARLFVMNGETIHLNANGYPTGGAGYYEAVSGGFVSIEGGSIASTTFEGKTVCGEVLRADKVAWDHDGKLISVSGLRPDFCHPILDRPTDKSLLITSDLSHPKIANGNLYVTLEGHGTAQYWVKIEFGRVVRMGKAGDKGEIPTPSQ